jgi:hypothetical protein
MFSLLGLVLRKSTPEYLQVQLHGEKPKYRQGSKEGS